MESVILGGLEQWITKGGHDSQNPVLFFLHGGPGGSALARLGHYNSALEEHFVVVNWDQRGAGKSYSADIPAGSYRIEEFASVGVHCIEWAATRD